MKSAYLPPSNIETSFHTKRLSSTSHQALCGTIFLISSIIIEFADDGDLF
jgi:hypothetical protein